MSGTPFNPVHIYVVDTQIAILFSRTREIIKKTILFKKETTVVPIFLIREKEELLFETLDKKKKAILFYSFIGY